LFGIPPYGGSLAESLYYADDNNLCDASNIDTRSGYPIRAKVGFVDLLFMLQEEVTDCTS
jgi:hypothetical protein